MRRSVLMTRLVTRSGRVGLTRMWMRLGGARAALGVADDPAHGVAGGDRTGADELLALLQGDVGDLTRRRVDLIERAAGEGIDLHGVDEAVAHRLHAGGGVGLIDALRSDRRLRRRLAARAAASAVRAAAAASAAPRSCTGAGGSASAARRRCDVVVARSPAASCSWRSRRAPKRTAAMPEVRLYGKPEEPALRKDSGFIAPAPSTS